MRIAQSDQSSASCITVRNLTDGAARHPLLDKAEPGSMVALYGLEHNYHSGDYAETQNTVIFVTSSGFVGDRVVRVRSRSAVGCRASR
jgi:hypothetical protein